MALPLEKKGDLQAQRKDMFPAGVQTSEMVYHRMRYDQPRPGKCRLQKDSI